MCDNLAERCAREVDVELAKLVDAHQHGLIAVRTPLYAGLIPVDEVQALARLNRAGLFARAWFERHGPPWAQPLPLCILERIKCFLSDSLPLHFVAIFSLSLEGRDYDYLGHPQLFDHARALMADPRTLEYLRENPMMRAEFPPKPIAGLDDYGRWRPLPNRASKLIEDFVHTSPRPPRLAAR